MLTLSLLRHAKSNWDDAQLGDHERPLARRGTRDAPRIGAAMLDRKLVPDLILCSGAVRARATLTLVLSALEPPDGRQTNAPRIVIDDALYLAEPSAILTRLAQSGRDVDHILIVGHNPGLHALALEVTGAGERRDLARLALGFPTAALAVVDFEAKSWDSIGPGQGRLRVFISPKHLD